MDKKKPAKKSPKKSTPRKKSTQKPAPAQEPEIDVTQEATEASESEDEEQVEVNVPPPKRTGKRGVGPAPDEPEKLASRGKQNRLPGMEDAEIEELEDAAKDYASLRDDRMHLLSKEVEMKDNLLALMKKHGKLTYTHDGVEVRIVHENEKVKVKIKKEKEED